MIFITGATGHFGKAVIDFLLAKGTPANTIGALVRDRTKATDLISKGINTKVGDYNDYSSLIEAFTGVDKLLLVSGSDIVNRLEQHANVVNAAKEAGVKHLIYTSFVRKNDTATSPIAMLAKSHIETEKFIKASGIPFTILKNSLYAEVLPMFLGEKVLETGVYLPAGNGKAAFTTRLDMAEAGAAVLTGNGHENKEYILAGNSNYSLNDVAVFLTELTGKEVAYTIPAADVYTNTMVNAGVPLEYAGMFAGFGAAIEQGEFETSTSELETLLNRKPTTLKEYLQSVYTKN
ncbi:MAG: SDR family oxidoreductase [Chitinophagaceae bacterium]|nr:SDR family oxidoreductase [Chitinophagaceae bacterium]